MDIVQWYSTNDTNSLKEASWLIPINGLNTRTFQVTKYRRNKHEKIKTTGLLEVSTSGTDGTGNQRDLRGKSVYFEGKFVIHFFCGTGKQNIFSCLERRHERK